MKHLHFPCCCRWSPTINRANVYVGFQVQLDLTGESFLCITSMGVV